MKRALILAGAVLAGCSIGTPYQRPPAPLPAQYAVPADGSYTLAADWWQLFGDPELSRLVDKCLAANTDLAQAVARVEQAEGLLREAGGALVPTVNLGSNANRSRGSRIARAPGATGNDFSLSLSTSFEIDLWGKLRQATDAARSQWLASLAARDTVALTLSATVAQAWFSLRSLDDQIAATADTLRSREESVRLIGLRLQGGTASRLDLDQAEVQRADAAVLLRDLARQRQLVQSLLGVLTADPALAVAPAPGRLAAVPALPAAGLPSALLERRPDIRRAEELLVSAHAQVAVARASMFPTLSLSGSFGGESSELSRLLESPARFWSLGFGLTAPLFDGGRLAARTDQAGAREREAVAAYQSAVSTAFKEVADALANLQAAQQTQADLLAKQAAAQRALKFAQARFTAGYSGSLERLDAERTATAATLDVVRNRQAQLNASVDLIKALGGGWAGLPAR